MSISTRNSAPRAGAAALLLAVLAGGCARAPDQGRPSDGLLGSPELQRVVELQVARDGGALTDLLGDPSAAVRARAALALASVQYAEALAPLTGALDDGDDAVRRDAAFALGQLASPESVQPLLGAFAREPDRRVREAIIIALSKLATPVAASALLSLELVQGEEAARTLALARLAALRGVGTREGQDHLFARLDDLDPDVRLGAAYYFGRLPDPGVWSARVSRIREALDGYAPSEPAAMHLLLALGRLGDAADGARLREWAGSARDWRVRVNAVTALAALAAQTDTREALFRALDDPEPLVGVAAAQALARSDFPPSELARLRGWIEAHPERWQAAAPLLGVLARSDEREFVFSYLDGIPAAEAYRWAFALQTLAFIPGDGSLERLGRAIASTDPRVQGAAVGTLVQRWSQDRGFSGSAEAYFPVFVQALRDGSPQAGVAAARALADPAFQPLGNAGLLVEAYRGMDPATRSEPMMAVLEGLSGGGYPEARPLLEEAAVRPEPAIRLLALDLLRGLGLPTPASPEGVQAPALPDVPELDWAYLAELGPAPALRLETERGTVLLRLRTEEAPLTVQTLTRLAREGRYDGVAFHRVVPNFVVQGGDFSSGDGFGAAGFTIRSEFTTLAFREGVVGMASAGKDTEGSQFFITHSAQPHLDGSYTAFGRVERGKDVVDRLMVGDVIVKATVEAGG